MNSEGGRKSFRGGVRVRSIVSRQRVRSLPPSFFLLPPSFLPFAAPVGVSERGAPRPRRPARPPGERPRLVTGAPKGYVNRGGLRRRGRQRARERDRARSPALAPTDGEPLRASQQSQHGAAFCLHLNRPVRPACRRLACPSPSRRGRPEILKSRNQFSIINHIFCQTAEDGRAEKVKSFGRSGPRRARPRWIWPARRRRGGGLGKERGRAGGLDALSLPLRLISCERRDRVQIYHSLRAPSFGPRRQRGRRCFQLKWRAPGVHSLHALCERARRRRI